MGLNFTIAPNWIGILTVFVLVALGNVAFEHWKEHLPFLVTAQLKFHQLLSYVNPRRPPVKWVALVEIDDQTFWHPPFSGTQPTNRRALGDLVRRAANGGALVIALDIQLKSPFDTPGDDPVRAEENKYLLESIREVSERGVGIVLTQGLVSSDGRWKEEPNIFDRQTLPAGVSLGYINLPEDKREIPLRMKAKGWVGRETVVLDSFAFQIVDQYEQSVHIAPRTCEDDSIVSAIGKDKFVYGGFVPADHFLKISARDLINDDNAQQRCRGRIVMIGGAWHVSGGRGSLVESFASPLGRIPGLYLHANYVEALLDNRFQPRVPLGWAILIDLVAGLIIYSLYHLTPHWAQLGILAIPFGLALIAYVLFANIGRYLDFVLPMALYFVHLVYEHFRT
jgi:CHASE2 domain-containing sensor protein